MKKTYTIVGISIIILIVMFAITGKSRDMFNKALFDLRSKESEDISMATIDVSYSDGAEIVVNNITKGWSASKDITITNKSNQDVTFSLTMDNINRDFSSDNFVYTIDKLFVNGANKKSNIVIPMNGSEVLINEYVLKANDSQKYRLVLTWKSDSTDEDDNNKMFSAKLNTKIINVIK